MTAITRRALGALTLTAAFTGIALPSSAADKINVGILSLTSHSPSIIAEAKGYFDAQDLDVEFVSFQAAQPMAVAIASGDVDFGMTAISGSLISLADKGVIKVIGGALQETPDVEGQKILASKTAYDAGVKTPADLKGRTYGITTTGSSFHYMAHKIADKEGFDRSEIQVKPLQKVPAVIASLKSGQIDAWSIVPNIAGALTKGPEVIEIGKISDYIDDYQVTTVFTSTENATEKKDLVERFLAGLSEGIGDYNAALVDKSMSEEDTAAIVEMIHQYVYSDQPLEKADPRIRAGAMRINEGAALSVASVEDQLEWFKSEGLVPDGVTMEKLVDTSFVETR
ncbi:ABC transporter substrate-binding protein [uncultured Nitratireductor sp.]|uniref:ABC transporter substrate-binding protein n=1 Tax=uncultured Nitratireductor sp. TaxID=520953 RepID=UPI0025CC40EF|nr:ABC transporter substrate-binding protein [uncultured Nitratireductor sp.]